MVYSAREDSPGLPGTRWSKVEAAADPSSAEGQNALETLLGLYRPWLIQHLRAKFHVSPQDAEDLFQSFIELKVLQQNLFARADPRKGRFRTYLFAVLDRFTISELRRSSALKRSVLNHAVPLDALSEEDLPASHPPEQEPGDFQWAQVIVAGALLNMQLACERADRPDTWGVFVLRVLAPRLVEADPIDYDELVLRLGLDSPAAAFNLLNTAKRMFRREVFRVLEDFAEDEKEVREELEHLQRYLRRMARSL